MSTAHIWTGQEILHLTRFQNILRAASRLVGHDDFLANLLLEDALEELHGVIGEHARPIAEESGLQGRCTLRGTPVRGGAAHRRRC